METRITEKTTDRIPLKIVFYTHSPSAFRTTLIGHLYEIAQVYPVTLLAEELDPETDTIIRDKNLFPNLEEIIPVRQFTGKRVNILSKNRHLHATARYTIEKHKPDVLILLSDVYPFDLYLIRFAKKKKIMAICIAGALHAVNLREAALEVDLINAYLKISRLLPFCIRMFIVRIRKCLGYLLYNWALPLVVGELPFPGASIVFYSTSGSRADYFIPWSKQNYDVCIEEGVPPEKLYVLTHPLAHKNTKVFFEKAYFLSARKTKTDTKAIMFLMPFEKIGFRGANYSLISEKEIKANVFKIIVIISEILNDWNIFIKLHPHDKISTEFEKGIKSLSKRIKITDPFEPADKYVEISDVIVASDEPSTVLFTASLQCPEKVLLSLNFQERHHGDFYKDFKGVEYIDNEAKFRDVLMLIRDGKYRKQSKNKTPSGFEYFANTAEFIEYLYHKNSP